MRPLALPFLAVCSLLAQPSATLVLIHGKIWTGDPHRPEAEAVACLGSRIVAVGSNEEIRKWAGKSATVIDLHGLRATPGFNDAHVHFASGGADLSSVQLRTARSESEFRDRIAAFAAKLPQGRWITGGAWDHENWTPARLPTRQLVDAAAGDHPLFISRLDGHMSLVNTLVLQRAHITRATPDPPGGTIVRDAQGEPTGILKDAAQDLAAAILPAASEEELTEDVRAAMRYANERGVTSVQDMSAAPEVLRVYQKLLGAGELTVRISGHQPLPEWKRLAAAGLLAHFGGDQLRAGGTKGFADGSLGSTTALFFHPYLDAPDTSGLANDEMIPESKMLGNILGADRAGLQVAIHAIGDKANKLILDMYEQAEREDGPRDRRFRIEHAQHLRQEDIPRFARLHVVASMQPYHAIDDGRWAAKRVGAEVLKGSYAFRSLLDSGAILAFGSDWDVAPMDPILGIYAAVTRRTLDGKNPGGWLPEQKITAEEALRAYTYGSAYASFDEKSKGTIAPGMLADITVLSDDILKMPPEKIRDAKVALTIFNGREVYRAANLLR
jgi:predicted amidohydrolase YtcJ